VDIVIVFQRFRSIFLPNLTANYVLNVFLFHLISASLRESALCLEEYTLAALV